MELKELIQTEMQNTDTIKVGYECDHHTNNSDFINVYIGKTKYKQIEGNDTKAFQTELEMAVSELTAIIQNIHLVKRRQEFHFLYPGFNAVHYGFVAVEVTTDTSKQTKPRIKTESYSMCGWTKLKEVIDKHPDYELYKRMGFAFRGARESKCTIDDLKNLCSWAACIDIDVIDDEIHVNGFSANDMW